MADFRIHNHGSVSTVIALSDEAKAFAEENFAVPSWSGSPTHFCSDTVPVYGLMEQMASEGFEVDGL